ncbi:hypothetical protein DV451_002999 [Geotrichum candidum]|uniref:methylated diphthine methylhydrolase n=1 Tax=Geotrichum candidum TaxID=1173061 RepID=A0A9P5G4M1_GEOCN|nr:hypothetical protein DV451_002999 [Geotrichum candidum]KAF5122926.1 hypothetical protein DV495_004119 [Geotrichum candidum]KAI8135022.1 hypothetical protein DUD61_001251 [Geotrichum candidum]KAI9211062.1 hypothetical protein DS838_004043 [Geotrichum bryndzae]
MTDAKIVARAITELPPCALQFHPVDTSLLVLGTYKLEEATKTRHGSIDFYRFDPANPGAPLTLVRSHATPGSSILDVKISQTDPWLLFTAQSTGSVIAWRLDPETLAVTAQTESQVADDPAVLVLSISFQPQDGTVFSATLSDGGVSVCKVAADGTITVLKQALTAHGAEAWISAFGTGDLGNTLFTGGDDSTLIAHDLRELDTPAGAVWQSRRLHSGGITSILPYGAVSTAGVRAWTPAGSAHRLWTGGYDDCLKSIDLRMVNNTLAAYSPPRVQSEMNLGGGVWRLVPGSSDTTGDRVVVCCMYDGGRIVEPFAESEEAEEPATVVKTIREGHTSMVYGADWSPDGKYVATCSFYDKAVQVWEST